MDKLAREMIKHLHLAVTVIMLVSLSLGSAFAQSICHATMYRSFSTVFEDDGKQVVYSLSAVGSDWILQGYGYHGTALAICETCKQEKIYGGPVRIGEMPLPYKRVIQEGEPCLEALGVRCTRPEQNVEKMFPAITTAQERIEGDIEHLSYRFQPIPIPKENRIPVFQTDELRSGAFKGYGVAYKIRNPKALGLPDYVTGMIAFGMNDQCAALTGTIAIPIEKAEHLLKSFADAMVIEREDLSK